MKLVSLVSSFVSPPPFWLFGRDVVGPEGHRAREGKALPGGLRSRSYLWL